MRRLTSRLIRGVVTLLVLAVAIFLLGRLAPGDPARNIAGPFASTEDVARLRESLGLDRPLPAQVGDFLQRIATGNFGESVRTGEPVLNEITKRIPRTLALSVTAMVIAFVVAICLAVAAVRFRSRTLSSVVRGLAVISYSAPVFWLALVAIDLVGVRLQWLPTSGYGGLRHLILPALILAFFLVGPLTELLRDSLEDVMSKGYIVNARARGITEGRLVGQHALRNAVLPALAFFGTQAGVIIGGAAITETVFAWHGVGMLTVTAATTRDYPLLEGVVIVIGISYVLINAAIEFSYAALDPSVRAQAYTAKPNGAKV